MIQTASVLNTHIETLKEQLDETQLRNLDYLFVAHADSRMVGKLHKAFVDSSIAVISIPQFQWEMDHSAIDDLMEWALNELSVKSVILVGSSQGGTPSESVQVCAAGEKGVAGEALSLVDRINAAEQRRVANEDHFLKQLNLLQQSRSISSQTLRNGGLVQGLLYRAESGLFCCFDSKQGTFRALIGESCIA